MVRLDDPPRYPIEVKVGVDRRIMDRIGPDLGAEWERTPLRWPPEIATCRCCQTELPVRKAHPGTQQGLLPRDNELALQTEAKLGQSMNSISTAEEEPPTTSTSPLQSDTRHRKETISTSADSRNDSTQPHIDGP